ncbi:MAG: cytochrome c oxidase accessory protein CcoG [Sphingobacteriales bacterium]|nr:cytochrome c oxidase accessory protein CcoG [Sphingobacteriales bacterium]MBI3716996.1 cytochrome c oxidase accessory protein CcoG [Sphingobacteriales bacterium]
METTKEIVRVKKEIDDTSFRDRVATVDAKGHRKWVFAQKPKGRFYRARTIVSWGFFLLFLTLPFIYVKGRPFFLFNIPKGKFILFGQVFWPHDFFVFAIGMVTFVVFIVLFTAAFGRLFCGWVCPQTNFMEMAFRKIEYLIDGDAASQKLLKNGPWNGTKIRKRLLKHGVFFLLSFIIANYFLAYIIGVKDLWKIITSPVSEHFGGFAAITIFSFVFYSVYAFFREQACTVVCPYGRLQGVLLDRNSMLVAYDYKRGEPRGKYDKRVERNIGDCIDCHQCVKVCPTGIDIRNGTQLECVNCTACIDACDAIMTSISKPKGLIRYASENGIANHESLHYTTRMKMYTILLVVLVGILTTLLVTRAEFEATVMRSPGLLYQEMGKDSVSNLYNIRIANKSVKNIPVSIKLEGIPGRIQVIGNTGTVDVKEEAVGSGSFFVILPKNAIKQPKSKIMLGVYDNGKKIDEVNTNFLGPVGE